MEVLEFRKELKYLMSISSVNSTDFGTFIKFISALSRKIIDKASFTTFSQDVKDWIGAFKVIFLRTTVNIDLQKYINKHAHVVTRLYFKLLQHFDKYERTYIQEFYSRWKEIVSSMSAYARAASFVRYNDQFKLITNHLEDGRHRFEQMTILKFLQLYTENVTYDVLKEKGNDSQIVEQIIKMGTKASRKEQQNFLSNINVKGTSIITAQPTNAIIIQQTFTYSTLEYDLWIDFNLKDESVVFVAVPLTNEADQCMGIVSLPQVKENIFMGNYLIIVSGNWNLLQKNKNNDDAMVKIMFVSELLVQNTILKSKSVFRFLPFEYGDPHFKDVNQNPNSMKESCYSDTTVFFPSVCCSSCIDSDETPCKKPRIGRGAIKEMPYCSDGFDSDGDEETIPVDDWTHILHIDEDSPASIRENLPSSSANLINRGDISTSKNCKGVCDNQESIADPPSFTENQSERDEFAEQLQAPCNVSEKVHQENIVSQPQQASKNFKGASNTNQDTTDDPLPFNENQSEKDEQYADLQAPCNTSGKVQQENIVSQPQQASKNFKRTPNTNQDTTDDPSPFNENQSDKDEQYANLQARCNISEKLQQENIVSQPQQDNEKFNGARNSNQVYTADPPFNENHSINEEQFANLQKPCDMSEKVLQENNDLQPPSTAETSNQAKPRLKKRIFSTSRVSTYTKNNGEVSLEIRSHNVSIVEETVNDVTSKANKQTVKSSPKSRHSNDLSDLANNYRKRLRPQRRTASKAMRLSTAAIEPLTGAVNVDPAHQMQNELEQSLKAMTEFKDQFSRFHGEFMKNVDQHIERFKSLLDSRRSLF